MWRCPAAGVAYIEWAASLKNDEKWVDKNDPNFGKLTSQALAAQETLTLYNWWKAERPKRSDPSIASGWNDYCDKKRKEAEISNDDRLSFITNNADNECSRKILDICHQIEREQEEEDTSMLIRLVKIRQNLWT